MQEDKILDYLKNNPTFFEENASFLAEIRLPSPHGDGAISLAERQQLAQRDKIDALKERFAELILNAQENDTITNKTHHLNLALHKAAEFDTIEQLISVYLPDSFDLADTCLRVWEKPLDPENAKNLVFSPIPNESKSWINELTKPYCGAPNEIVTEDWFIDPADSLTIVPLRLEKNIGFLALASQDKNRFYAEMETDLITKVGEIISAALSRYIAID